MGLESPPLRLQNHPAVSAFPLHPSACALIGLLFAIPGAYVILGLLGFVGGVEPAKDMPPWVLHAVGALFLLTGAGLVRYGVAGMLRLRRSANLQQLHPDQPWMADYRWNSRGTNDARCRQLGYSIFGGCIVVLLIAPFNFVFSPAHFGWCFGLGFLVFLDLIGAVLLIQMFHRIARRLVYGLNYIDFTHFPYRLGRPLDLHLRLNRLWRRTETLRCTLRYVEERFETTETNDGSKTVTACYALYNDTQEIALDATASATREPLAVRFELPDDREMPTRLAAIPPRYWQLELTASAAGQKLKTQFLLPVY